eukprot:TRINITY_DN956_c0_g1_i10.p1 TRINITY_DN956_c0_g1~~TRINITY_DN956_c0_g1_i10.p1  ORF type:complete len:315 (+),score=54.86 TRINITY_DN956_c0_g1_i10:88-1032(+)
MVCALDLSFLAQNECCDEDDYGPPELLSPEVTPRIGIPEDVDVHDPVYNVRVMMKSSEMDVTEGLLNYAVKRKAILCNDHHPFGGVISSGCTLGQECNQIHVRPAALEMYRKKAASEGAKPRSFVKVINAVDPKTGCTIGLRFAHTEDTTGRDAYRMAAINGTPSEKFTFCMQHLTDKGCPKRKRCPNIHAKVDQWRKQSCCQHHTGTSKAGSRSPNVIIGNHVIPWEKVAVTKGLRMLRGDDVILPTKAVCKYHLEGYCKLNVNCEGIHLCRGSYTNLLRHQSVSSSPGSESASASSEEAPMSIPHFLELYHH